MKMSYQLNSSRKKRHWVWYTILIIFFVVGLVFQLETPGFLGGMFQGMAKPAWYSGSFIERSVANVTSIFRSKNKLISENETLKETLRDIRLELLDRDILKEENMELKRILGRVEADQYVLGAVLAKPNRTPYDTLIIDAGRDDGVTEGNHIVVGKNLIIGELVEVFGKTSKGILYSSPGESTEVRIGTQGIFGTAHGVGGGNFAVEVPRDMEVSVGDPVTAPGISHKIFGVVESIDINPTDSFQIVRFTTPVNIFELDLVLIQIGEVVDVEAEIIDPEE